MKREHAPFERAGFLQNFRAQPLLFIGSAVGLLAVAVLKGGLGQKRAAGKAR